MKKILVILVVTILLCSCKMYIAPLRSVAKYEQATSREIKGLGIIQVPTIADLEVAPTRITEDSEQYILSSDMRKLRDEILGGRYKAQDIAQKQYQLRRIDEIMEERALSIVSAIQKIAKSEMLIKYDADVLIDPRYSIEIINNERVKVSVSGYLGKYKNFRPIQAKDSALFRINPYIYEPDFIMGGLKVNN